MQISRHWRIKPQRYRLEGLRYENGEVSLQPRPVPLNYETQGSGFEKTLVAQPIPHRRHEATFGTNGHNPETLEGLPDPMHSLNGVHGGVESRSQ